MLKKASIVTFNELKSPGNFFNAKKVVLVGGCFDLIHYGHFQFLKNASQEGDFLVVALEGDDFIKKYKRKTPVHTQSERAEILASLNMVDMVLLLPFFESNAEYDELVKLINPKVIAVTKNDKYLEMKKRQAKSVNAKVKIVTDFIKGFSTRKIITDLS